MQPAALCLCGLTDPISPEGAATPVPRGFMAASISLQIHCLLACRTCWFHEVSLSGDHVVSEGDHKHHGSHAPLTTLMALEHTIQQRREAMEQQTGEATACKQRSQVQASI